MTAKGKMPDDKRRAMLAKMIATKADRRAALNHFLKGHNGIRRVVKMPEFDK